MSQTNHSTSDENDGSLRKFIGDGMTSWLFFWGIRSIPPSHCRNALPSAALFLAESRRSNSSYVEIVLFPGSTSKLVWRIRERLTIQSVHTFDFYRVTIRESTYGPVGNRVPFYWCNAHVSSTEFRTSQSSSAVNQTSRFPRFGTVNNSKRCDSKFDESNFLFSQHIIATKQVNISIVI